MGAAVLTVHRGLGLAFLTCGVDDVEEVASGAVQVGRVQPTGLGQERLLAAGAEVAGQRELLDRIHDHPGLLR